jgi:hypothetical protein
MSRFTIASTASVSGTRDSESRGPSAKRDEPTSPISSALNATNTRVCAGFQPFFARCPSRSAAVSTAVTPEALSSAPT